MGVRFFCPNGHKLHVKSFLAGKRGICPHCDVRFTIPHESTGRVAAVASSRRAGTHVTPTRTAQRPTAPVALPIAPAGLTDIPHSGDAVESGGDAGKTQWYVRPPSGGQYGPADTPVLQEWIEQGRVPPDARVWRDGWDDWRIASDVIGELVPQASGQPSSSALFDEDFPALDPSHADADFRSTAALRTGKRHSTFNSLAFGLVALVIVLAIALGLIVALR